jgi:hypothetical protein
LDRGQKLVSGSQRVAHQNSERRRTIQQDEIECFIFVERFERFRQAPKMVRHARDFDFGTC